MVGKNAMFASGVMVFLASVHHFGRFDMLNGLDSNSEYGPLTLQAITTGFCLSPLVTKLLDSQDSNTSCFPEESQPQETHQDGKNATFVHTGHVEEDDYQQGSIYSMLYALYKSTAFEWPPGQPYNFTFNTWGISEPHQGMSDIEDVFPLAPYPESEPQRHGKAAYRGLATQRPAVEYALASNQTLEIVEVGCGTGAGANLITREVWKNSNYLALDMQQAAINTCNKIHATADNPALTCRLIPNGVGRDGARIPDKDDSSVDFVIVSETHIAELEIGDLEKAIFAEIKRVLKPGGLFLWGNALPTHTWLQAMDYLPTIGFELVNNYNHTEGAVVARQEDKPRMAAVFNSMINQRFVFEVPYFGPRCALVCERLLANFARHPGTAMYLKMVSGYDSYMHQAWRKL